MEQSEIEKKIWGFIYLFVISDKGYVGQASKTLKTRFKKHFKEKSNPYFHNSLRKYFRPGYFHIIETHYDIKENLKSILNEKEIFWIAELDTFDPKQKKGWNLTKGGGGNLGRIPTKETKKIWSKQRSGNKNSCWGKFGKDHPAFGNHYQASELTKQKQSENAKKRFKNKENHPMFGTNNYFIWVKKYGKETADKKWEMWIEKQKINSKGENNGNTKSVILISPENKEYKLSCYSPFCKEHNLNRHCIRNVLQGKQKHHRGWTGRYST